MDARSFSGTTLGGRYRVGAMLGEGGMGAVYEALQEGLARKVALKILHPHLADDAELRGRFQREAHIVAMLGHPNVVQISDFQANDGEPPFLVMELLHGENLRDVLKKTPRLPPARVAYIAVQVLSALDAAHRVNVVHRDIKPDNIFLEKTSVQADIVKVLDFGVAKILGDGGESALKLTRAGLVVGTLSYMPPEQATGDPIDGRADLYSLGAAMYLALTGKRPFEGATTATLLQAILTEPPVPVASIRQDVGVGLSNVIDRALAKSPSDRFASAAEMARALAPFARPTTLDAPMSALPSTPVMTVRTPPHGIAALETTAPLRGRSDDAHAVPKTIAMRASTDMVAPVAPLTQRSSYHPHAPQPTIAMTPLAVSPRRSSLVPWIIALTLGGVVAFGGVAVALVATRPWEGAPETPKPIPAPVSTTAATLTAMEIEPLSLSSAPFASSVTAAASASADSVPSVRPASRPTAKHVAPPPPPPTATHAHPMDPFGGGY